MPFDAQRATHDLELSARLDAKRSEQAEAAQSASAPAPAAPAAPAAQAASSSPVTAAAPSRFQRNRPQASAPAVTVPSATGSAPPPRFHRTATAGAPSAAGSTPPSRFPRTTSAGGPSAAPAPRPAPAPRVESRPAVRPVAHRENQEEGTTPPIPSRGYGNRVGAARATSLPGLTPRLELYIDELGFQKGWSDADILRRKQDAATRPAEAERDYRAQFDEIRRLRQETVQTLQQGLQSRPGQIVFVVQRGEQRRFSALPKERAGSYALLHGSAFHSMPASATLFAAPAVLFAPQAAPAAAAAEPSTESVATEPSPAPAEDAAEGRPTRGPRP